MSSVAEKKRRLRAEREEREREAATSAANRSRLRLLGAAVVAAAVIVAMLVAISSGGAENGGSGGGRPQGAGEVARLFRGIPQRGLTLGRPDAPVTMVEFADLQCPFCAEYAHNALPTIVQRYVRAGKVRLELHLISIIGPDSEAARRTAAAVAEQNRMWNFSELFYLNQGQENSGYVTDAFMRRIADAVRGVDAGKAFAARGSASVERALRQSDSEARARGVDSTPSFFIGRSGGRLTPIEVSTLQPSDFAGPIDRLLAER
jgi:protein-disulfide isomerase